MTRLLMPLILVCKYKVSLKLTRIELSGGHSPVAKAWSINVHGEGDRHRYQPGQQDGGVSDQGPRAGAFCVTHRGEHCLEPVQADPNHAIDGGGAEKDISRDPGLAQGRPQAPGPRPGSDQGGQHHQHSQAQVSHGEGEDEPICSLGENLPLAHHGHKNTSK